MLPLLACLFSNKRPKGISQDGRAYGKKLGAVNCNQDILYEKKIYFSINKEERKRNKNFLVLYRGWIRIKQVHRKS